MGQVCERQGEVEKAVVHYNRSVSPPVTSGVGKEVHVFYRSLQLRGDQREVVTSGE